MSKHEAATRDPKKKEAQAPQTTSQPTTETTTNLPATQQSASLPAVAGDSFAAFAGAGMENVTSKDLLIPRITILQSLSPQVLKSKPEYIEGAKVGDICDVGLSEIITAPLIFLPVHFSKVWIEWAPRSSGKGLIAIHSTPDILNECVQNEKKQWIVQTEGRKGNYVSETAQFFGLNLSRDGRRSFIPMASSALRSSRRWNTLASSEKIAKADGSNFTPPLFYRSYQLDPVEVTNNEGTWVTWKVDRHVTLPEMSDWKDGTSNTLKDAVQFRDSIIRGETRADVAGMEDGATDGAASTGAEGKM